MKTYVHQAGRIKLGQDPKRIEMDIDNERLFKDDNAREILREKIRVFFEKTWRGPVEVNFDDELLEGGRA